MQIRAAENEEYGSYLWLMREVGSRLGLDPNPSLWDHSQYWRIDSIVQSGYQQFCHPPAVEDKTDDAMAVSDEEVKDIRKRAPHSWSWLNRIATIETADGRAVYDLPSDFSGGTGDLVAEGRQGRLPIVAEEQLRVLINQS